MKETTKYRAKRDRVKKQEEVKQNRKSTENATKRQVRKFKCQRRIMGLISRGKKEEMLTIPLSQFYHRRKPTIPEESDERQKSYNLRPSLVSRN